MGAVGCEAQMRVRDVESDYLFGERETYPLEIDLLCRVTYDNGAAEDRVERVRFEHPGYMIRGVW